MVVTRQTNHRDSGETGEDNQFSSPPEAIRASLDMQPQMSFVFHPPNSMNTGEEFDIAEETDSVQCDSETKETASEITEIARRSDDGSPSRGGTEVVRLLASLHDLSRQMEVTMVDLRAQLGSRLGSEPSSWHAGDYGTYDSGIPHQSVARQRLAQMKRVVKHTWRGVLTRLLLLWQLICLRYPAATARLTGLVRRLKPYLPALGYLLLANVTYGVYTTHRRLVEQQKRRATPWI